MSDIWDCRIEAVLEEMSSIPLCDLPEEEPLTVDQFQANTQATCEAASQTLAKKADSNWKGKIFGHVNNIPLMHFCSKFNLLRENRLRSHWWGLPRNSKIMHCWIIKLLLLKLLEGANHQTISPHFTMSPRWIWLSTRRAVNRTHVALVFLND